MNKKHTIKEFNILNIDNLDNACGIYAFWFNSRCIYVGKTEGQTLKIRLKQHYCDCHNDGLKLWIDVYGSKLKFCYLKVRKRRSIDFLERKFIYRLQPVTNKRLM